jgi:hypothetical protein
MAHEGSWPSIREYGLLSTSALLDLYRIEGGRRIELEERRRPHSVPIVGQGLPGAVIRDQKPIKDGWLAEKLEGGMTPAEFYRILNAHSFFWLSLKRVRRLVGARAYRAHRQTILTIDTGSLLGSHADRIKLSPINSGAVLFPSAPMRGAATFRPIGEYPFDERLRTHRSEPVVELLVEYGVPDIVDHVLAVHQVRDQEPATLIWRRDGVPIEDAP